MLTLQVIACIGIITGAFLLFQKPVENVPRKVI